MKRVVVYARVSTDHEEQLSALGNQIQYYNEILSKHPDWILVNKYIDEGITGTSINKRDSFLQMMEDAKCGLFDLIITREVSRFARNIVDTLQQTRILKGYGVETWFVEDNIWTMNDEDGELRLSIMATMAQNESKKTSIRVKAGQMISFKNGVLYGNGNILGYDKVDRKLIINKEQAKTVRRIYDLYLAGNGARKIKDILEQEHRLTSTGLTNWHMENILKILKNSFYCGRIEYRKQYVPDYLTQKKINNHGEVEKIYIEGTHETIVTQEEFDRVQEIIKSRTKNDNKNRIGKNPHKNIWSKKLICNCGSSINRRTAYTSKVTGEKSYIYQCQKQQKTGTPFHRLKKGLSIEGICDNNTFPEWKLEIQADFIFRKLIQSKNELYNHAMNGFHDIEQKNINNESRLDKIKINIKEIDNCKKKMANLIDMCINGDISREIFKEKQEKINNDIKKLENDNEKLRTNISETEAENKEKERLDVITAFLKMDSYNEKSKIPISFIDAYVTKITYYKGEFCWYLDPIYGNMMKSIKIDTSNLKKKKTMSNVNSNTGCYQRKTIIENPYFMGTYNIPVKYIKENMKYYQDADKLHIPDDMKVKVFLV